MKSRFKTFALIAILLVCITNAKSQCSVSYPAGITFNTPVTSVANFYNTMNTTFGAGTVTLSAGVYTLSGFSGTIVFNDVFGITQSLNIVNCPNITFGANGRLNLLGSNIMLTIDNSTLRACGNNLWNGISALNGSGIADALRCTINTRNNAKIQDAIFGIDVNNDYATVAADENAINVDQTTFDKNYIGIRVTASQILNPTRIKRSKFTCTATLFAPFSGQRTYAGVALTACGAFDLGDATITNPADYNLFDGLACGFYNVIPFGATNVYSSEFRNIAQYPTTPLSGTYPENAAGSAIFNRGLYVFFIGTPDPTLPSQNAITDFKVFNTCKFSSCFRGIELHNTHATVDGTAMANMEFGIVTQNCNQANINITNNAIDNVRYGMFFSVNNNSVIKVNNGNTILMPTPYGAIGTYYGIRAVDWPSFNSHFSIEENQITGGAIGIRLENTNNTSLVNHNEIVQQNTNSTSVLTVNTYGIQADNCVGTVITENVITGYTGAWTTLYHQTGINIKSSPGMLVRCNEVNTTGYGLWTQGDNTTTDRLENNTFNNHKYGLYLTKVGAVYGKVGNQGSTSDFNGNLFNGAYTGTFKTFNQTDASQSPAATDVFWYNSPNSAMYTTNFSSSSPIGKPIQSIPITGAYSVPTACPVYFMRQGGGSEASGLEMEQEDALAIAAETKTYTDFEEVSKWMDERKLYDILDAQPSEEPVLQDFYTEKSSSSVGKLKNYNNAVEELATTSDYWQKVEEAIQKNNEVPAAHRFEQNEKDMNTLFLNNIAIKGIDRFDEGQTAQILALAQSCPFTEGKAVYLARVLYSLINPSRIFDDEAACEAAYKKAPANTVTQTQTEKYAFINPNPSNAQANLFLNLDEQETGELLLLDLTGRVVLTYTIIPDKTIQLINLETINAGAYVYSVHTKNGFNYTGKLTVVK